MDEMRPKIKQLNCDQNKQSEARDLLTTESESTVTSPNPAEQKPNILEEILEKENVKAAIAKVQKNAGAPGIDGLTVEDLVPYLAANWNRVRRELVDGSYKPKPVRRVEIDKPGGGIRTLGIPTVLDRVVQQAFLQVLQPKWDPTFSTQSFGFRPNKSQHQAIDAARELIRSGYEYVVDLDLEKFFDRVNHDILMARIAKRIDDKRVLKILRAYLNAGILEEGLVEPSVEGVPQGGPLSPLLSNLLLDDLDKELEKRELQFVRFADDCNIYVKSERAGLRVKESITKFLAKKLRLRVNEEKSAVGKPSSRNFLGFTFGRAPEVQRLIAKPASRKAKEKIQEILKRGGHQSLNELTQNVVRFIRGWINYFGHTDRPSDVRALLGYARRRLRWQAWQYWKTPERRRKELVRLGIDYDTAYAISYTSQGAWRISKTRIMNLAFSNDHFRRNGFPTSLNGMSL
jgi:RNA-directed DNA polymerase